MTLKQCLRSVGLMCAGGSIFVCFGKGVVAQTTSFPQLIDLSGDTARQVTVDREPGQYLGHPTTVLLEDGKTLIAVYPKGHGVGPIVMRRSTDGGRTWSARLRTPSSWETQEDVPTIYRVIDKSGVKRLLLFSGGLPVRMSVSDDDGLTWSELKPIGAFGGSVVMSSMVRLDSGEYLGMFSDLALSHRNLVKDVPNPLRLTVFKTMSANGGLTWSAPEIVATHEEALLCEPAVFHSPDRKQLAVLMRDNTHKRSSYVVFSNDQGKTWSQSREVPEVLAGDRHAAKYAPSGRLVVSYRDRQKDSPYYGDWVAWVGTFDDIVHGRGGQYKIRLMDNKQTSASGVRTVGPAGVDDGYPGIEVLLDGTFVITSYGHWLEREEAYITSVRFRLEEIDMLAKKAGTR